MKNSEKLSNEMKNDSEIVAQTNSKLSSSQKRRIRKVRLTKFLGINLSKFRKRQIKETRLGRMRKTKRIRLGRVKKLSESDLTKCNGKPKHKEFRTNPNKVETKVFQSRHDKVKSQKGSLFGKSVFNKTQNRCVELSRWLGEKQSPKINNSNEKSNFPSEHWNEKLTNFHTAKRKSRLKNSLERQGQECINCQILECLFQKGINLTKSIKKIGTNWSKLNNGRATNKNIPFKMKRKTYVKAKKMNVKMKTNSKQNKSGKPKWKIKFES
jgi:hypothetical protein